MIASDIPIPALLFSLPSLGQEARLLDKQATLENENLQLTEELEKVVLVRNKLFVNTEGQDRQVLEWEKRTETLKNYLVLNHSALENPTGEESEN